ncbi:MAG: hypothetical protein U5K36_15505 [Roseovarius sp.]|nr:hypothetical protein [Roseovarius sp.]
MAGCCGEDVQFDGMSSGYKRRLVIAINAALFVNSPVQIIRQSLAGRREATLAAQ